MTSHVAARWHLASFRRSLISWWTAAEKSRGNHESCLGITSITIKGPIKYDQNIPKHTKTLSTSPFVQWFSMVLLFQQFRKTPRPSKEPVLQRSAHLTHFQRRCFSWHGGTWSGPLGEPYSKHIELKWTDIGEISKSTHDTHIFFYICSSSSRTRRGESCLRVTL